MGKGSRNSQQRRENQAALSEALQATEKSNKKKKNGDRWIAVTCIVLAVLIVAILAVNILNEAGVFLRVQNAAYIGSDKDISVNAAMMTFFYNNTITTWYNSGYNYMYVLYGLMSVDMSSDLTTQTITSNDASYLGDSTLAGSTWYDYFMDTTVDNVTMYLTYAYAGNGIPECELDDADYDEIDETVKSLKESLKEYQMSFADQYGKGVTEIDVRACYELIWRANKFSEYKLEQFEAEFDKDEAKLESYRDSNKEDFYSAKYLSYTIDVSGKGLTEENYAIAVADAKTAVEKLSAAKTPAEFVTMIELYEKSPTAFVNKDTSASSAETDADTETDTDTEAEDETTIEELIDEYTSTVTWQTGDELSDWIFVEEADEGAIKVIEETATETTTETVTEAEEENEETDEEESESTGTTLTETVTVTYETYEVTVYMILEKPGYDEEKTHNIAYVLTDNKKAADDFLAAFSAESDKTRELFEELAEAHYNALHGIDEDGNHNHDEDEDEPTFNYANVDQAKAGYFSSNYDALNKWLDDEVRAANQLSEIIEITTGSGDSKQTYYGIVFFESEDEEPAWRVDALDGAVSEAFEAWYDAELEKGSVHFELDVIEGIGK